MNISYFFNFYIFSFNQTAICTVEGILIFQDIINIIWTIVGIVGNLVIIYQVINIVGRNNFGRDIIVFEQVIDIVRDIIVGFVDIVGDIVDCVGTIGGRNSAATVCAKRGYQQFVFNCCQAQAVAKYKT